jgi:hypothetical protein
MFVWDQRKRLCGPLYRLSLLSLMFLFLYTQTHICVFVRVVRVNVCARAQATCWISFCRRSPTSATMTTAARSRIAFASIARCVCCVPFQLAHVFLLSITAIPLMNFICSLSLFFCMFCMFSPPFLILCPLAHVSFPLTDPRLHLTAHAHTHALTRTPRF